MLSTAVIICKPTELVHGRLLSQDNDPLTILVLTKYQVNERTKQRIDVYILMSMKHG